MKTYKVHDDFFGEVEYMTEEEIRNYAEGLADRIEEEDERGDRPTTDTFDDCISVLESANSYVKETE